MPVQIHELRVQIHKLRVTSSNPRLMSSNPRVTNLNLRALSTISQVTSSNRLTEMKTHGNSLTN